ncbi:unnamed protein product [Pleuronectes platessa]|uniref:Uncharacterized protein n=1 Tax=Pleuronectes platessa TaxID=8262 RepID=A0A9N7UCK1_PLEPL|nr:unnamed protein product [Pleuronectes platessa]
MLVTASCLTNYWPTSFPCRPRVHHTAPATQLPEVWSGEHSVRTHLHTPVMMDTCDLPNTRDGCGPSGIYKRCGELPLLGQATSSPFC